ncbi:hypothetical protein BC829DRAFT_420465 [Chytridium lagenaria]|nr:hypothetical protein BC829DRAFT_420465 [Chytridium lagenaria]
MVGSVAARKQGKEFGGIMRQTCSVVIDNARIDPLVSPGKFSSHSHTVAGASKFHFNSTGSDIQTSSCTTCSITVDKSNYWYPSLYYVQDDGNFRYVPADVITYYMARGNDYNIEFPQGFAMIAGNPYRRAFGSVQEERAVEWLCIGRENPNNGVGTGIPQDCEGSIRGQLHFPMCGDGRLYSSDQSHVAYPTNDKGEIQMDGGKCPSSHPTRFVKLFLEFWFGTEDLKRYPRRDGVNFVLSNGDPTGFGLHADFLNGWEKESLQTIIDECDYGDRFGFFDPSKCDFIRNGRFQDNASKNKCQIEDSKLLDVVEPSLASKLPGCNPIQYGPERATMQTCDAGGDPSVPPPPPGKVETEVDKKPYTTVVSTSADVTKVYEENGDAGVFNTPVTTAAFAGKITTATPTTTRRRCKAKITYV